MAENQIDRLTVGVGLTNDEFRTGVDEILESIDGMRASTERAADGMGASFASMAESVSGLALKFTGLFLAVRGIEDVVGYFKDLSAELANLSWNSEYLGQSAHALRVWGQVAKDAGGDAQDAIAAAHSLQSAIFGLEYNGQMSQNLLMLSRLRVAYTDAQGNALPLNDIALNAAKALEQQFPGDSKGAIAMRVSWAEQIFGAGGVANAVGGPASELRKSLAKAIGDNTNVTKKAAEEQKKFQQALIDLKYDIANQLVPALNDLTPEILDLIGTFRNEVIPTIHELIVDFEDWLHPKSLVDNAMGGKGVGPLGFAHPINTFEAIGIGLGIRAGQFHDWYEKQVAEYRLSKLSEELPIPADVSSRLSPGMDLDALRLLHIEAGGAQGDPTWSKAITAYPVLSQHPGGAAGYVQAAGALGKPVPGVPLTPSAHRAVVTPGAARPAASAAAPAGSVPTASLTGPRVSIGDVYVQTQATDANRIAASIDRALQRKILTSQADPGLA